MRNGLTVDTGLAVSLPALTPCLILLTGSLEMRKGLDTAGGNAIFTKSPYLLAEGLPTGTMTPAPPG